MTNCLAEFTDRPDCSDLGLLLPLSDVLVIVLHHIGDQRQ